VVELKRSESRMEAIATLRRFCAMGIKPRLPAKRKAKGPDRWSGRTVPTLSARLRQSWNAPSAGAYRIDRLIEQYGFAGLRTLGLVIYAGLGRGVTYRARHARLRWPYLARNLVAFP